MLVYLTWLMRKFGSWRRSTRRSGSVRACILGFGHLEGLTLNVLEASAFEGSVFTHLDAKPGMVVKGKVTSVGDFGADVQLSTGVKEFCPLTHMSEPEVPKPGKKFKVKPQLSILSSFDYATDGLITHGWIRKVETHG